MDKRVPNKETIWRIAMVMLVCEAALVTFLHVPTVRGIYEFYMGVLILTSLHGIWKYARMNPADIVPPNQSSWIDAIMVALRVLAVAILFRTGHPHDVALVVISTTLGLVLHVVWLYRYVKH